MDGSHFDEFARSVARSHSRRRLLASLASGVIGLVGFGQVSARTCTAYGTICRGNADCCSNRCGGSGRLKCQCRTVADCPTSNNPCLTTICDNGTCTTVPRTGDACDDGNPCTVDDRCTNTGRCQGTTKNCAGESDGCNTGVCRQPDGACIKQPIADGTGCNADSDSCTENDYCDQGVCKPGTRRECNVCSECSGGDCRPIDNDDRCPDVCCDGVCCDIGDRCENEQCTPCKGWEAACDNNNECCSRRCTSGQCERSHIGEICSDFFDCDTQTCEGSICVCILCDGCGCAGNDLLCCSGICTEDGCYGAAGIGQPCQVYNDCGTNTCTNGVCACVPSGLGCLGRDHLCCSGNCKDDHTCA